MNLRPADLWDPSSWEIRMHLWAISCGIGQRTARPVSGVPTVQPSAYTEHPRPQGSGNEGPHQNHSHSADPVGWVRVLSPLAPPPRPAAPLPKPRQAWLGGWGLRPPLPAPPSLGRGWGPSAPRRPPSAPSGLQRLLASWCAFPRVVVVMARRTTGHTPTTSGAFVHRREWWPPRSGSAGHAATTGEWCLLWLACSPATRPPHTAWAYDYALSPPCIPFPKVKDRANRWHATADRTDIQSMCKKFVGHWRGIGIIFAGQATCTSLLAP